MVAKAGEKARESGRFHCADCNHSVYVKEGDTLPPCPCGKNEYDRRSDEPGNRSSS